MSIFLEGVARRHDNKCKQRRGTSDGASVMGFGVQARPARLRLSASPPLTHPSVSTVGLSGPVAAELSNYMSIHGRTGGSEGTRIGPHPTMSNGCVGDGMETSYPPLMSPPHSALSNDDYSNGAALPHAEPLSPKRAALRADSCCGRTNEFMPPLAAPLLRPRAAAARWCSRSRHAAAPETEKGLLAPPLRRSST